MSIIDLCMGLLYSEGIKVPSVRIKQKSKQLEVQLSFIDNNFTCSFMCVYLNKASSKCNSKYIHNMHNTVEPQLSRPQLSRFLVN